MANAICLLMTYINACVPAKFYDDEWKDFNPWLSARNVPVKKPPRIIEFKNITGVL